MNVILILNPFLLPIYERCPAMSYHAIFYQNKGNWIGPYLGKLFRSKDEAEAKVSFEKDYLKKKYEVRKVVVMECQNNAN